MPSRTRNLCVIGLLAIVVSLPTFGVAAPRSTDATDAASPAAAVDALALRRRALSTLMTAASHKNPEIRTNAVEALQFVPGRALPVVHRALRDRHPAVRYAAAVTAGQLKFKSLTREIELLLRDPDRSVQAAARYALHAIGEPVDLTPLADLLMRPDPVLRGNVAHLLSLVGDQSAVRMLKRASASPLRRVEVEKESVVRVQIAEAIAVLGDDAAFDALRAGAYSQFGEVRALSITAIGAVEDLRMIKALQQMLRIDPPEFAESAEVQLAAAGALARMGNTRGTGTVMRWMRDANVAVRAQAAWVLGWHRDQGTLAWLERQLADSEPTVRVHAAASVLRRSAPRPKDRPSPSDRIDRRRAG